MLVYLAIGIPLLLLVLWWFFYNRLVRLRILVNEAWSGIDVQLRRRSDVIPKLENCLERYMEHEKATLMEVTAERAIAEISASKHQAIAIAETELKSFGRMNILVEDYPDLKSDRLFLKLMKQIRDIENDLQHARRYYNGTVKNYDNAREQFPSNIVAGTHQFPEEPYFEVKAIEVPPIDFSNEETDD